MASKEDGMTILAGSNSLKTSSEIWRSFKLADLHMKRSCSHSTNDDTQGKQEKRSKERFI